MRHAESINKQCTDFVRLKVFYPEYGVKQLEWEKCVKCAMTKNIVKTVCKAYCTAIK